MSDKGQRQNSGNKALRNLQEMRKDADELRRVVSRAAEIFRGRPASSFGCFSELIDEVLPADSAATERVARALEVDPRILMKMRAQQLDPLTEETWLHCMAAFSQLCGLDEHTFVYLTEADHVGFAASGTLARGGNEARKIPASVLLEAWQRADLDNPRHFEH